MRQNLRIINKRFIVKPARREPTDVYPTPNFLDTGMALCGALKKGETLKQWIVRNNNYQNI